MRIQLAALILAGAVGLTGCSRMASLNTFVNQEEATIDPALIGVWQDQDGEGIYVVKQSGGSYAITATDKSSTVKLEARLLAAGDLKILDITAREEAPCQNPVHIAARVWINGATLRMVFLDSDWLRQLAVWQLGAHTTDGRTVIASPGSVVRDFLVRYGDSPEAHGDQQLFLKVR
jgi:hypothetical protein